MSTEAETPLEDHVQRALKEMQRSPIMRLDAFPNDPSMMMCSFTGSVAKEIADRLAALIAERDRLVDALASVQPFVPLGYAPTGRYGGADDRNAALDLARGKMELALNRAALSPTQEKGE